MTSQPSTKFRWRAICASVAVVGLLLTVIVAERAAAQIKSNLSSSVTSESMAAVWVARDRGLFKKHGLDMQFILMPRNPLAIAALLAGEIDAAIIGPGHLVNAGLSGAELIGIANFFQKLDYRLISRPEIKRVEDLRGKRVAISGPGSTSHLVTLLALQGFESRPGAGTDHLSDHTRHRDEPAPGAGERQCGRHDD